MRGLVVYILWLHVCIGVGVGNAALERYPATTTWFGVAMAAVMWPVLIGFEVGHHLIDLETDREEEDHG